MRGFVRTPEAIVDLMVAKLFSVTRPTPKSRILDPGCGTGVFIDGILRWCAKQKISLPEIVGIELDPDRYQTCVQQFAKYKSIRIENRDFLTEQSDQYDYVISNPPYVGITGLGEAEKQYFRQSYETATGRFDLYMLFFEQSLRQLKPGGSLVFITPEKFLYVKSASALRVLLAETGVSEIDMVDEGTFGDLITYPVITSVHEAHQRGPTKIEFRDGRVVSAILPEDGNSWLSVLHAQGPANGELTLESLCHRISCGVATGADGVFVVGSEDVSPPLRRFAFPTIAGRQLVAGKPDIHSTHSMLVPYTKDGALLSEDKLGHLKTLLAESDVRQKLEARTCVTGKAKKQWYAFHENPPLPDILRPKILCKDITDKPYFWIDEAGGLVPRHTVYYIVPKYPERIRELREYLNSEAVAKWLEKECQRASKGFLRLQSTVLKKIPVPSNLFAPPS